MAVKQTGKGTIQRATHVDQLKPSRGHLAILVAEDGDTLKLEYDEGLGKWVTDPTVCSRSNTGEFPKDFSQYYVATVASDPADFTIYVDPQTIRNGLVTDFERKWRSEGSATWDNFGHALEFEVQKWIKCGLNLQLRAFIYSIDPPNGWSDVTVIHTGVGFDSYTYNYYSQLANRNPNSADRINHQYNAWSD